MNNNIIVSNDILPITYLDIDNTVYIGDQFFVYELLEIEYYDI